MKIRFWGVRGSVPTPLTPTQIQAKISAAIQRITPKDIESPDARERFIASLPRWIFGTTGGNTPCIEITSDEGKKVILDAGTGIRVLGKNGIPPKDLHYDMLFSHFHWDHIQGFPFFDQAYNPKASFDIWSPFDNMKETFSKQMAAPYYPVTMDTMTKNMNFHTVKPDSNFKLAGMDVSCQKMNHPGTSYSYALTENNRKFVYATDVELCAADFNSTENKASVFEGADALVLDSQYTVEEAYNKQNWGHSAYCYAIDFAIAWHVKRLYLFHHEPTYDDRKLNGILQSARWYASYVGNNKIQVFLATEGMEIKL